MSRNGVAESRRHPVLGHVAHLLETATMSLDAARNLSIPDLLRVLNEKLGLECSRLQNTPLPPASSTASLESEVSVPQPNSMDMAVWANCTELYRSKASKPEHTISRGSSILCGTHCSQSIGCHQRSCLVSLDISSTSRMRMHGGLFHQLTCADTGESPSSQALEIGR